MTCGCGGGCQQLGLRRSDLQQLDGVLRRLTPGERRRAVQNVLRRFPPHQRPEAAAWLQRVIAAAQQHPAHGRRRGRPRHGRPFAGDLAELQCTGKYNNLVVAGGGDAARPCAGNVGIELYCNQGDVDAWHVQADNLFDKYRQSWNATVKVVDARGGNIPDSVRAYANSIERDYCKQDENWNCVEYLLPTGSWWNINENVRAAQALVKFCQKCACMLELLDTVRAGNYKEGASIPLETPVKPDPLIDLPGATTDFKKLLMYGGIGLLAVLLLTAVRR